MQDIRVGGRAEQRAVPVHAAGRRPRRAARRGSRKIRAALSNLPRARRRQHRPAGQGTADVAGHRPRHRVAARRHAAQLIDTTLNDAFGQRQVSTIYTPLNQYHVVMEAAPEYWQRPRRSRTSTSARRRGAQVPLSAFAHYAPTNTRARREPPGRSSSRRRSRSTCPRASSLSQATRRDQRRARAHRRARRRSAAASRARAQAFQASLDSQPWLILAALLDGLHRARHPLRELRAPDHDPVDAAVGRRRRAARAAAVRHRVQRSSR